MKKFSGSPLGDIVIVRPIEEYQGPLVSVQGESRIRKALRGLVVTVGKGATAVKRSDVVLFNAMTGVTTNFAGDTVRLMHESDILAVVETR